MAPLAAAMRAAGRRAGPLFTGVRVGVTCAKMLALATGWLDTPPTATSLASSPSSAAPPTALVAVHTLEVLAQNADQEAAHVAVVGDARRGQVYAAFFQRVNADLVRRSEDLILSPDALRTRLAPGTLVVGDGVVRCSEILREAAAAVAGIRLGEPDTAVARARHVARLGWRDFRAGRTVSPHDLTPIYLRRPEAIDRLLERQRRKMGSDPSTQGV